MMMKKHDISPLKNTFDFTISTISKSDVKQRITFEDICWGGNALHLTMGYILIIKCHNPNILYKLTENLYKI